MTDTAHDQDSISIPCGCPNCGEEFRQHMTPSYAIDLVSCVTAALAQMPVIDSRTFKGGARGRDL